MFSDLDCSEWFLSIEILGWHAQRDVAVKAGMRIDRDVSDDDTEWTDFDVFT